jgi:hypothetical protein
MIRTARLSALLAGAAMLAAPGLAAGQDTAGVVFDVPSFADVEPEIRFPACIGIARIEDGAVTQIPVGEGVVWDAQFDLLGDAVGRKVDVLMTSAADPVVALADLREDGRAAGLDYAVVYELAFDESPGEGPSAVDLLRVFPTFEGEQSSDPARAAGAAVLMDIADGRMYGVASAIVIESEAGYGAETGTRTGAFEAVVKELSHEVETAFVGIMIKSGMPDPQTTGATEIAPEDLTQEQIIAQADREFMASTADMADDRGC